MIRFLSKIVSHSSIQVIGITLEEEVTSYASLLIQKKRNNITVLKKETFTNFEELTATLDSKTPIILHIDGKGILNKKIDFDNEQDVNWYKNIKLETLSYTSSKNKNVTFLSFTRKNLIDEWVTKFTALQFQVLDVYTGSFISSLLAKTLDKKNITTSQSILHFEETELVDFSRNENKDKKAYKIGEDILESSYLPLYASVIHFLIPIDTIEKSNVEGLNIEEYTFKKAFNYLGVFMLAFYLILLLISYFGINYLSTKNAELNYRNVYSNQAFKKLEDLEKQKNNKLKILSETGLTSNKFLTFYAYTINKNTLNGIHLSELKINPLEAETKPTKKVLLLNKVILISGQAQNELIFNNWIENLKKMTWIKKFEIISIDTNKKNWMQFQIKILVKDV
jgi:hypothetical protein